MPVIRPSGRPAGGARDDQRTFVVRAPAPRQSRQRALRPVVDGRRTASARMACSHYRMIIADDETRTRKPGRRSHELIERRHRTVDIRRNVFSTTPSGRPLARLARFAARFTDHAGHGQTPPSQPVRRRGSLQQAAGAIRRKHRPPVTMPCGAKHNAQITSRRSAEFSAKAQCQPAASAQGQAIMAGTETATQNTTPTKTQILRR